MTTGEWDPAELRRARKRYEIEHGDISYKEIGARVGTLLRRKKPVSVAVVSYWFTKREPKFREGLALARVLEADPFELGLPPQPSEPLELGPAEEVGLEETPKLRPHLDARAERGAVDDLPAWAGREAVVRTIKSHISARLVIFPHATW